MLRQPPRIGDAVRLEQFRLPENAAADAALRAAAIRAWAPRDLFPVKTSPERTAGGVPSSAGPCSLEPNDFGKKTVELRPDGTGEREITVCFIDDSCLRLPAPGDGTEHQGHLGRFGMTTVSASIWSGSQLTLWVDEVEDISAWKATLEFAPDRVRLCIAPRGKTNCSEIAGHASVGD